MMAHGAAPRVLVCAGEPSGDQHAAALIEALRDEVPEAVVTGFGGARMAAAGADVRWRMEPYTALGFVEVVGKVPRHLRLLQEMRREFVAGRYDLVVVVDYPGFHLRVAEAARSAGIPVLYYVAPQLWAWHPGRARRMARAVDALAVILPFEPAFFASVGIQAEFVGHPLAEVPRPARAAARTALGLSPAERVLALCPGSRRGELARLWPRFREAALGLLAAGRCDRVVVAATSHGSYPGAGAIELARESAPLVLAAADAGLVKSGTTTLEAALAGLPMVVAYRVHPLTGWMARRLLRVRHIGLVNLVAGREVVPELVQGAASPTALAEAVAPLLEPDSEAARRQRADLAEVGARLGGPGTARQVARIAARLLGR